MTPTKLRVVQCWDDGNHDDIRLCDILRRHGGTASFNLNPGIHRAWRYDAWRHRDHAVGKLTWDEMPAVYRGFTIANHSMSHPWPSRIPIEAWRAEVVDARKILQDHFQQPVLGFAYPFGDFTPAAVEVVREAGHVYARTCQGANPCMPVADPLLMPTNCHHSATDFWDLYAAAKTSTAKVFYFWGHSYEFTDEAAWAGYEAKIARIAADPDAEFADLPDLFI